MEKELQITGDFTTEKALLYKAEFHELAKSYQLLTLDLHLVEKADIVGINTLATTHKKMEDKGGKLLLKIPRSGELRQMLQLTKFDKIFNFN